MNQPLPTPQLYWVPEKIWVGGVAYIIGGGPSLSNMDWASLHDKNVIGCNDAYTLGDWVDVCFFCDKCWFVEHYQELEWIAFKGMKVSGVSMSEEVIRWRRKGRLAGIPVVQRLPEGLFREKKIAFNYSTGAAAINLAVLFGAVKIVLLGFDMKLGKRGEANWHSNEVNAPEPGVYRRKFWQGFVRIAQELKKMEDIEVINANPDSELDMFPKVKLEDVL